MQKAFPMYNACRDAGSYWLIIAEVCRQLASELCVFHLSMEVLKYLFLLTTFAADLALATSLNGNQLVSLSHPVFLFLYLMFTPS